MKTNLGEERGEAEMESLLDEILMELPEKTRVRYDRSLLLGGYASFMLLYKELDSTTLYHKIYQKWYKDNAHCTTTIVKVTLKCIYFFVLLKFFNTTLIVIYFEGLET